MNIDALLPRGARVVVVGDVMLDAYLRGAVSRISPEAPVPVLQFGGESETIGGAGNVALNLRALGAEPVLIGVVGADAAADRLRAALAERDVAATLVSSQDRPTTVKTRILAARHQQMLRIDRETSGPVAPGVEDRLLAAIQAALAGAGALILSDYAKGCLTDRVLAGAIAAARARAVPVLIDPKRRDFAGYAGADYIKPNLAELAAASGHDCASDEDARAAALSLAAETGAAILLTLSARGMRLYAADGHEEVALPTAAREVFDVSGAGDTVIAVFTLALVGGSSEAQAMRLANLAAGVVVSKAGTATVTREEIAAALADHGPQSTGLVVGRDAAIAQASAWRDQGLEVGFTNGCFDLLHPGHIAILRGAAEACDRLVVGLNSDASVRRLKGPTRPIQTQDARATVLSALRMVDAVTIFDEDTPADLIAALVPDVLIKGADYEEHEIVGADVVKAAGGRVVRVALVDGQSTSKLVARSQDGGS